MTDQSLRKGREKKGEVLRLQAVLPLNTYILCQWYTLSPFESPLNDLQPIVNLTIAFHENYSHSV